MKRKTFYSHLFRKKIQSDNFDYWMYLYAEAMFREKELEELRCPCASCFADLVKTRNILKQMEIDGYIPTFKRPKNFTGLGDCGRKIKPISPRA
jgi:hypothetical protein